jgi:hypothetical protein
MKVLMLAVGFALVALPAAATAACAGPSVRVADPALTTLLQGNTVCVPVATQPTMTSQEFHQAGGALIDYKRGPSDPVDPTKIVGTWAITGGDRFPSVTYTYPPSGGTYTYSVWDNLNGTHSFCSPNPEIIGTVISGQVSC